MPHRGCGILIFIVRWLWCGAQLDAGTEAICSTLSSTYLAARRSHAERLAAQLNALSPVKILERGYALVFDANGLLVKDVSQLEAGSKFPRRWREAASLPK